MRRLLSRLLRRKPEPTGIPTSELQNAIRVAVRAHDGQIRWGGSPYILHPISVMMAVQTDFEKVVAILHDVLEDRPDIHPGDLVREGISKNAVAALNVLNKRHFPDYEAYIEAIAAFGEPVVSVKLADLRDNMGDMEWSEVEYGRIPFRASKYQNAYVRLTRTL